MKKIVVSAILLIITSATFSQQTNLSPAVSKQDYLKKSKKQQTAATILLIGCPVLVVSPPLIFPGLKRGGNATLDIYRVLIRAGFLCLPGSIILFIISSRTEKKGMSFSFKNETAQQLNNNSFTTRSVPSLALKISL